MNLNGFSGIVNLTNRSSARKLDAVAAFESGYRVRITSHLSNCCNRNTVRGVSH